MRVARGDLWTYPADWRVITTNGFVKKTGEAVMGRGTAYQAKKRWPKIAYAFGQYLIDNGNHVGEFVFTDKETADEIKIITMPVKHAWWEEADLTLIERSCIEMASLPYDETFAVPKPGCGNGKLDWEQVRLIVEPILDDRFIIMDY